MAAKPAVTDYATVNVPLADVVPYVRNPRKNTDAVAKVAASIREFGFRQPIVCDPDMVVIAGHTRLQAAQSLGLKTVPVHIARGLSTAQVTAYRLADNRTGQEAEWDNDLLGVELKALVGLDFDLALTGFNHDELDALLNPPGIIDGTDLDAVPELPAKPVTKVGDLIILGRHRLVCGDSTCADVVDLVLGGGGKPLLMVTDPPYGVNYDANWRNETDRANGKPYGARAVGLVQNDDRDDWGEAWALYCGDVAYVFHGGLSAATVQRSLENTGLVMRSQIIWAKTRLIISRGHYHGQHETCWYACRKGATANWIGDRKQTTLWTIEHTKSDTGHSTQKPVEAMRRPIQNHSGDVYDPFLGSGTTLIAAELEGRICYGIELSPAYCDVIVQRWETATGQKAVRP